VGCVAGSPQESLPLSFGERDALNSYDLAEWRLANIKDLKTKMERQDAKFPSGLSCSVDTSKEQVQATALVDSGANGISFIDQTMRKNKV
jgi:hypothetical protein